MEKSKSRIYYWQDLIAKTAGVKREIENSITATIYSKPIKIITGFRRSGKSFLVRQIANKYYQNKYYDLDNILYLNFEDYHLTNINTAEKLGALYEYFSTEIANSAKKRLLVFDEIQNVKEWDKFIRTIYESELDIEIMLTGSNSKLLSSELSSCLAGRFIEFFIHPFSFREFLVYKNKLPESKAEYHRNNREIKTLFKEYSIFGGLPEVFEIQTVDARKSYLSGVLNKVILDDIIKRFNVDNIDVLEKLLTYLLASSGKIISYSKIESLIKSYGSKVCFETIVKYISYFIQTFSIFEQHKFDWKLNKYFATTRKFFTIDTGLLTLYKFDNEDYSLRIENLIFIELLRQKYDINFGMNSQNKEIDFILQKNRKIEMKIQVCIELTESNYKRETDSFLIADKYLKNSKNLLLTFGDSKAFTEKDIKIEEMNILEWLIFNNSNKE